MSKKYTKDSFSESLDRRLSGFQADPWLAQRVMASEEGEVKPVKKMSFAAVLAIVLVCVLATGALAAAMNIFGLGDFLTRYAEKTGATISENIGESFRKEDVTVKAEHATYTIHESYYDGEFIRAAMTIKPEDNVLLINDDDNNAYKADDDLWCIYQQIEPETMTIAECAEKNHNGQIARIEVDINPWPDAANENEDGILPPRSEYRMNEDSSVTIYYQWNVGDYIKAKEERNVLLKMSYTPGTVSGDREFPEFDKTKTEITEIPLKIHFTGNETYVCDEELEFPEAGIKVTRTVLTVTPLDINCVLYYKVTKDHLFASARTLTSDLLFQFVYPDSTEPDGYKAYPWGFAGDSSSWEVEGGLIRATFSVSREAFGDHYVLRAFNREKKRTFGTVEFDVKPWEEENNYELFDAADDLTADWLYDFKAEKPSKMTTENTSCEKNGIRLELVSSSVKDGMMNVVFSLEDPEGNRINETTEADVTLDGNYVETRYDADQKKLFLTWNTEYEETKQQNYELEIDLVRNHPIIRVDLLPLLEKYGSQAKLIHVREEDLANGDPELKTEQVLDYTNSLEVPLSRNVMLSGIGMENGVLRVQFHYPMHHYEVVRLYREATSRTDEWYQGPSTIYATSYECDAFLYEADEYQGEGRMCEEIYGSTPLSWGLETDTGIIPQMSDTNLFRYEWDEYHFNAGTGLTETQKLTAEIADEEPPMIGMWTIHVPASLINTAP